MAKYVKEDALVKYNKAIELLNQGYNAKTAAEEVGVKMATLLRHMKVNGISYNKPTTNIHPKYHQSIKKEYLSGSHSNILAEKYGCSNDTILRFLKFNGIDIVKPTEYKFYKEGYTINRDAFKDLETEESAYYFGWLITDGNLSDSGRVSLQVQRSDEDIILNFQKYIGLSRDVLRRSRDDSRTGKTYYSTETCFSDVVISDRLIKLGMEPRKSMKEVCPEIYKANRHFWRGVLEGDGWIVSKGRGYGCGIVGSESLLRDFEKYCKSLGVSKIKITKQTCGLFQCVVKNRNDSLVILRELYKDTELVLPRKYSIFKERYELHT